MKSKNTLPILGCVAALLVGCVGMPGGPGESPGAIPPRLVAGKDGRLWDNSTTFGKVPPGRQAEGNAVCQQADFTRATGFHPDARNTNGTRFPRGGFYCEGKRQKDSSSSSTGS